MVPTPGGALEFVNDELSDPLLVIVARLAQGPMDAQDDPVVLADLVQCNFPGYAPIRLVPRLDDAVETEAYGQMGGQILQWEVGAIVTPQLATHIYYTRNYNATGEVLAGATVFDNPIVLDTPGQVVEFEALCAGMEIG